MSIPLIIYVRITLGTSKWFIPACIALAVAGQMLGSGLRKKQMTPEEKDRLKQIPDLNFSTKEKLNESEVAVILLNMGGPRTNDDVRDFQKHLFNDSLLIRFPLSFFFQQFFAWILIKFRLKAVKGRYMLIGGGSPIYKSTTHQARALRQELQRRGRNVMVTFSFNYSPPYPYDTVQKIKRIRKKFLLPLSLYPHYSKATTGSNIHYLLKAAKTDYPALTILKPPSYYLNEGYIRAFVDRITESILPKESLDDFYLVFSAHGLPLYFLAEGDPYPFQISQTIANILARLNRRHDWVIAYQSAVGPLQWLKPSTEDIIKKLAKEKRKKVLIVPISFVGDHIETSCEINIEYREVAEKLGINDFRMSKALECHPGFIAALADSVESVLNENSMPFEHSQYAHDLKLTAKS